MTTTRTATTHDQPKSPMATQPTPQGLPSGQRPLERGFDSSPPLHRYLGNGYVQAMTTERQRLGLQAKLTVSAPGDVYEREADRIADQIVAAPPHANIGNAPLQIQRFSGQSHGQGEAAPATVDKALASPSIPLESTLRRNMEQRFGYDFSAVRVHTGAAAERSAQDVNANAYTVGHAIVFDKGRFAPETLEGRRLIAHELTHVVQQSMTARRLLLRNSHSRAPILEPGTGFDGLWQSYGVVFDRSLTPDQVKAAKDYRAWMEASFSPEIGYAKDKWAREAGARAAAFPGNAQERAALYAEFQRQIVQATGGGRSSWKVSVERGADGAYIFRGDPNREAQKIFVVDPKGNCYAGEAQVGLQGRGPGKTVNYSQLRAVALKAPTGGSATAPPTQPPPKPASPPAQTPAPSSAGQTPTVDPVKPSATTGSTTTPSTAAPPTGRSVGSKPPGVSSRDLAAELGRNESGAKRMASMTKALRYSLGVWSAWTALETVAKSVNMAAALLARSSPFDKEIQHAQALESAARDVEDYYSSLDLRRQMPSKDGGQPEWNSPYDLYQLQLHYLLIEGHLHDALESVEEAMSHVEDQLKSLPKQVARKAAAAVMLPVTSLGYAEAYFFSDAGAKMLKSLAAARSHYLAAFNGIRYSWGLARAAAKVLELRLRELGGSGVFHDMSVREVKSAPLEKFTFRR
jgi:Domain of unknown function (DUF4157)